MGGKHHNWTKDRRRSQASDSREEEKLLSLVVDKCALEFEHEQQIQWLRSLAEDELTNERDAAFIQRSIDWLLGAPRRTLSPRWQELYRRIGLKLKLIRLGKPPVMNEERMKANDKRIQLARAAYHDRVRGRQVADFLLDSSKLPKAPPRRVVKEKDK